MIPVANTIELVDDLPGVEEIEFSIGDPRFVMRTQAELYSDVATAIIREYSTNAYDAHVMAGHRDPIEVTLPNKLGNTEFVVKDHGIGMDLDDFRQIYTRFGTSNKRESNQLNGQLGYGSKSGVAYTSSFTVTSVKNGRKVTGIVMRKPDWSIVLKVVSEEKTDEPRGTEIRIPVHDVDEFNYKAQEFYKFWLPGRVLINGKAPAHAVGRKIIDNLYYSEHWSTSYIVMGNVAYRIENPDHLFRNTKMNRINFVAYVDDFVTADGGAPVEFTPSREDLKYTPRTKATLQSVVDNFEANILAVAQSDIDTAKTHFQAYSRWMEWGNMLGRGLFKDLSFDGDAFEAEFKISGQRYAMGGYRNSTYHVNSWDVEKMDRTMVVTEFAVEVSSNAKAKVAEYANLKGWSVGYVLFTLADEASIQSPWINKDMFVTWEDIKAALPKKVRVPNPHSNNPNAGRIPGSFDIYTRSGVVRQKPAPVLKKDETLYYISVQDNKRIKVVNVLTNLRMDNSVILLSANRIEKFKRDFPQVIDFYTFAKGKVVKDGPSLLTQAAKDALNVSSDLVYWLDGLPLDSIKDPEWKRINDMRKNAKVLTKAYDDNAALASLVGMHYNVVKYQPKSDTFGLFTKYPLLKEFSYWRIKPSIAKEMAVYINAKHAESV